MVPADEFNDGGRRPGRFERRGAGFSVVKAAGDGSSPFESRGWLRQGHGDVGTGSQDEDHAVCPPLVALPDVMEQGSGDQLGLSVTMSEQVTGRVHRVDDVAGMLAEEEGEQIWREVRARERNVFFSWLA